MAAATGRRPCWPRSTHDTKRSEDVRARISLLSEIPAEWARGGRPWADMNERHKTAPACRTATPSTCSTRCWSGPIRSTSTGPWPSWRRRRGRPSSTRRGSTRTRSTTRRWPPSCEPCSPTTRFTADLAAFVAPLVAAGRINSLAQTLLKLTSPGVPDIYQGTELWDLSLVDPDNRRPVDYDGPARAAGTGAAASAADVLGWDDEGAPKLWLIQRALDVRRRAGDDLRRRRLRAAAGAGRAGRPRVVAFVRGGEVAVVVPRLVLGLRDGWGDTTVELPAGRWVDELGGSTRRRGAGAPRPPCSPVSRSPFW